MVIVNIFYLNTQRPDGSILDPSVFNGNFQHENGVLWKNDSQDRPLIFPCASDETNVLLLAWPQCGQNDHSPPDVLPKNLPFFTKLKYYWLVDVGNSNIIFGNSNPSSTANLDLRTFFDKMTAKWSKHHFLITGWSKNAVFLLKLRYNQSKWWKFFYLLFFYFVWMFYECLKRFLINIL